MVLRFLTPILIIFFGPEVDAVFHPERQYLEKSWDTVKIYTEVAIMSPVPLTGGWVGGNTMRVAAEVAMDIINSQQKVLPGYRLNTTWFDDFCNADTASGVFLKTWANNKNWVFAGAGGCSAVCMRNSLNAYPLRIPMMSYGCASGTLSDTNKFKGFVRFMTVESAMADVFRSMAIQYKWKKISIITGNPKRFDGPSQYLFDFFRAKDTKVDGLQVVWEIPRFPKWSDTVDLMKRMKAESQRVIVVLGYEPFYRRVICASKVAGIPKGVVWLSVGWHKAGWWAEPDNADPPITSHEPSCTPELISEYYEGGIGAAGTGRPVEADLDRELDCFSGYTNRRFREILVEHFKAGYPNGTNILPGAPYWGVLGAGADGVCTFAKTVKHMLAKGHPLEQLKRPSQTVYDEMTRFIREDINFYGVMGQIKFKGNNLPGIIGVYQVQKGARTLVAELDLKGSLNNVPGTKLVWGDGSTNPGSSFSPCQEGTVRSAAGSCEACVAGKYHDIRLKDCIPCDAGYANPLTGKANRASCRACSEGTFAGSPGLTACTNCSIGFYQQVSGATFCENCTVGQYQESKGQRECKRCAIGTYQPDVGKGDCIMCPNTRTTFFQSALKKTDCVCPEGSFEPALNHVDGAVLRTQDYTCTKCPEGMKCPLGSAVNNWLAVKGTAAQDMDDADKPYPKLMPSFYAEDHKPVFVYRCLNRADCPGGNPGTCAHMRVGFSCGRCENGYYPFAGECHKCSWVEMTTIIFPILPFGAGIPLCVFVVTRLLEPMHIQKLDDAKNKGLAVVFFMFVYAQTMGIIDEFNLRLPQLVLVPLEISSMFLGGVQLLRPQCAGGGALNDFQSQFLVRTSAPALVAIFFLIGWVLVKACGTKKFGRNSMTPELSASDDLAMDLARTQSLSASAAKVKATWMLSMCGYATVNAYGTVAYTFSISILAFAMDLFKCFTHPNGLSSLRVSPDVLCHSDQWNGMVVVGIFAILVYVVGSFTLFSVITFLAPRRFREKSFRRTWKFLLVKWRPNRWWFGQIFLLKGMLINLTLVMFQDGGVQLVWVAWALMLYLLCLHVFVPWRHTHQNFLDVITNGACFIIGMYCMYFAVDSLVNEQVLGAALLVWIFIPLGIFVGTMAFFFITVFRTSRQEVRDGTVALVQMEEYIDKLGALGCLERAHGIVHITQMERRQLLESLALLTAESTRDPLLHPTGRLWQRDAWIKPRPEDLPDAKQESLLKNGLIGWCKAKNASLNPLMEQVFGNNSMIPVKQFISVLEKQGLSKDVATYLGNLIDIYETGSVLKEAFYIFVIEQAKRQGVLVLATESSPPVISQEIEAEKELRQEMQAEVERLTLENNLLRDQQAETETV